MAISYPLTIPGIGFAQVEFRAGSVVGQTVSPWTQEGTIDASPGEWWEADITLPPLSEEEAEAWVAGFLLPLNGKEGTFLMGYPRRRAPLGDWAGSPKVLGAHAAGVKTIAMDGFAPGGTSRRGDWIQIGSGASAHIHCLVQDSVADGAGLSSLEIWPRTRAALADNDTLVTASPVGVWQLASNVRAWSIGQAQRIGIRFTAIEALRG